MDPTHKVAITERTLAADIANHENSEHVTTGRITMTAIRLGTPNANSKTKAMQMIVVMANVPSRFLRKDFKGTPVCF
jgi:hypothetical protein